MLKRLEAEALDEGMGGGYFAVIQKSSGDIAYHQTGPRVEPHEQIFVIELLTALNKFLHHDGAWLAIFTHHRTQPPMVGRYQRLVILWMDRDGDIQFPFEFESPLDDKYLWGKISWCEQCENAWVLWHHMMREVLEPKADQLYRKALGEAPTRH